MYFDLDYRYRDEPLTLVASVSSLESTHGRLRIVTFTHTRVYAFVKPHGYRFGLVRFINQNVPVWFSGVIHYHFFKKMY